MKITAQKLKYQITDHRHDEIWQDRDWESALEVAQSHADKTGQPAYIVWYRSEGSCTQDERKILPRRN